MKRAQVTPQRGTATPTRPLGGSEAYRLVFPELTLLREMERSLSRGRMVPREQRSPEQDMRLALFRIVKDVLRFAGRFEGLIAQGNGCKIIEREHTSGEDRLVLEFVIEVQQ